MPNSQRAALVLVAVLLAATPGHAQGGRYAREIATWVAQSVLNPPPADAVLFVGSSSIRRWESLARDFADHDVIQRGFGGSQFSDLNGYVDEIVVPYDPAAICVFEGTNDIAAGKSAATVFADYLTFVSMVRRQQRQGRPPIPILYLGITPTPARWSSWPTAAALNTMIAAHAAGDPSLFYVDIPSAFLATGSPPAASLFVADRLHLSRSGYALWSSVIRPAVDAVVPPTKVYAQNPAHPAPGARILLDLGPDDEIDGRRTTSPRPNGDHWNNWHPLGGGLAVNAGESLGDLVTSRGAPTGIDFVVTGGFVVNGIRNGGLRTPSAGLLGALAVATATEDYFFGDDLDAPAGFMLTGLSTTAVYDLRLFGSRNTTQTRITRYEAAGRHDPVAVNLQTSGAGIGVTPGYNGNESVVAEVRGLTPDAFGQLFVDVQKAAASFSYLNALEIAVGAPQVTSLAGGCGAGIIPPGLQGAVPRVGAPWPLAAYGLVPGQPAGVLVSLDAPAPVSWQGCVFHVEILRPANLLGWAAGTTTVAGTLAVARPVPAIGALYGHALTAQAFGLTPFAPNGFELSTGLRAPVVR